MKTACRHRGGDSQERRQPPGTRSGKSNGFAGGAPLQAPVTVRSVSASWEVAGNWIAS